MSDKQAAELAAFYGLKPAVPASSELAPEPVATGADWQSLEARGVPFTSWPEPAKQQFMHDQASGAANVVTELPQTDVNALKAERLAEAGVAPPPLIPTAGNFAYRDLLAKGIPFVQWPESAQDAYLAEQDRMKTVNPAPNAAAPAITPGSTTTMTISSAGPAPDWAGAINYLTSDIHGRNIRAGWWTDLKTGETLLGKDEHGRDRRNVGELLCLVHSEISEAMEGYRKNLMDDKLPHRTMLEVELADAMIRMFDIAGAHNLDLGGAIAEKLAFNANREDHKIENRRGDNGKKF